jgi:hypothetical protein
MSAPVRTPINDQRIELGTAVNWPLILGTCGLGLTVLTVAGALSLYIGTPSAPAVEATPARPAVAQREKDIPDLPADRYRPREYQPPVSQVAVVRPQSLSEKPDAPLKRVAAAEPAPTPEPVVVAPPPPPDPEPEKVVEPPPAPTFKRRQLYSEADLREQLAKMAREVDIEAEKGTTAKLLPDPKKTEKTDLKEPPLMDVVAKRADLSGMPFRNLKECKADEKEAKNIQELSRSIRGITDKFSRGKKSYESPDEQRYRELELAKYLESTLLKSDVPDEVRVRMVTQMLQTGSPSVRTRAVFFLEASDTTSARKALARVAAFDLDPEIREAAINSLRRRYGAVADARPVLLEALRYPWPAVADHAAEALVALDDRDAVFALADLLDKPDPMAPAQNADKKWFAPELVRVNHLGNCVLCHAPSNDKSDYVRGVVPKRGEPLPVVYYESRSGSFIRADVTYLKQDFSVMHEVKEPDKWPDVQRFDYMIRQRELAKDEIARLSRARETTTNCEPNYPQRDAVQWALTRLTNQDLGPRSEDWHRYLAEEWTPLEP